MRKLTDYTRGQQMKASSIVIQEMQKDEKYKNFDVGSRVCSIILCKTLHGKIDKADTAFWQDYESRMLDKLSLKTV